MKCSIKYYIRLLAAYIFFQWINNIYLWIIISPVRVITKTLLNCTAIKLTLYMQKIISSRLLRSKVNNVIYQTYLSLFSDDQELRPSLRQTSFLKQKRGYKMKVIAPPQSRRWTWRRIFRALDWKSWRRMIRWELLLFLFSKMLLKYIYTEYLCNENNFEEINNRQFEYPMGINSEIIFRLHYMSQQCWHTCISIVNAQGYQNCFMLRIIFFLLDVYDLILIYHKFFYIYTKNALVWLFQGNFH